MGFVQRFVKSRIKFLKAQIFQLCDKRVCVAFDFLPAYPIRWLRRGIGRIGG